MDKFTWFPKLTKVLESVPADLQPALAMALIRYGTYGEEPELEWPLASIFESLREDIDNSKTARAAGSRGGRARAAKAKGGPVAEAEEGGDAQDAPALQVVPTPLDEAPKGGSGETEPIPYQAIPSQTKPSHTKPVSVKRKRFTPPARDEAVAYGREIGLPDAEVDKFLDHFTANGWRVSGRAPMRDWRAALRNWSRNAPSFAAPGSLPGKRPPRSLNSIDPDRELERLEREYEAKYGAV